MLRDGADDVLDAMAQLGIQGSSQQLGRATVSAEATVSSLYGMAGTIRSVGRGIASEADEGAEAAGRASSAATGEIIGAKSPASPSLSAAEVAARVNRAGMRYPEVIDLRTGQPITFPRFWEKF